MHSPECGLISRLPLGDDQPVAGVEVVAPQQVTVALVPSTGRQIRSEPVEAGPKDIVTGLGQHRHAGPYDGIEVRLGPTPVGCTEPVDAVMGYGYRFDASPAEQRGEAINRHGPNIIESRRFGQIFAQ